MSVISNHVYNYLNGTAQAGAAKEFFKELLEAQYLAKFIKYPPIKYNRLGDVPDP